MALRTDGSYSIYKIQHRQKDGTWVMSGLDHFGHPPGFNASDACWQLTGEIGTFNRGTASYGLNWIREKHPTYTFRLVRQSIIQNTDVIE